MNQYHKIKTIYLRDPETNFKRLLIGQYAHPLFDYLSDNQWVFTEKVDGTNIRVMIADGRVTFGGKTDNAQIPAYLVRKLEERFLSQVDALIEAFPDGGCLYGEGYGAKIQRDGKNYRDDQDFVLFDVKVGDFWLERPNIEDVAKKFSLDVVPIIGTGTLPEMVEMAQHGFSSRWNDKFLSEGIVARPAIEIQSRNGERIITKIKHKDF